MRSSLFPNLLTVATMNVKHHNRFAIFEYGSVFWLQDGHPAQTKNLGLLTFETSTQSAETSFLTFKARLENLIGQLGVAVRFETLATHIPPYFHPTRVAHLVATSGQSLGYCGVIAPEHLARFGKQALGLYAELFSEPLQALASTERIFHGLSRFPLAERDISLIGARTLTYAQVEQVLKTAGVPLLQTSELFDVYEGTDEKSFAFHLGFGSGERTLTSDEVDATFERIVQAAADHLGMRLKSN